MFFMTVWVLEPLHGCWMACGVASTTSHRTTKRMVVPHMVSSFTTHGCWNTWVRRSRLDYSAVVPSIGSITGVGAESYTNGPGSCACGSGHA